MVEQLDAHFIEKVTAKQRAASDENHALLSRFPHRLDDNLHWHCSTCGSIVSTNKTQLHLITCLMTFAELSVDEECTETANGSYEQLLNCGSMQKSEILSNSEECSDERVLRPQTKKLERPTPNIKHPIIASSNKHSTTKSKSSQKHSSTGSAIKIRGKSCIDQKKSKITERETNSTENKEKAANFQPNKPVIKKFVKRLELSTPCKSCTTGSEKFHSHSFAVQKAKTKHCSKSDYSFNNLQTEKSVSEDKINTSLLKCYICENEFDTETLPAHEPSCLEKWKQANVGLPADQRLPQKQKRRDSLTTGSGCDPAGWEHFKAQLCPCKSCGRTFFPHRLAIHEKACKGSEDAKPDLLKEQRNVPFPVSRSRYAAGKECCNCDDVKSKQKHKNNDKATGEEEQKHDNEWQTHLNKLEPCDRCGRTFFPHRLHVHQPHCKAKPVTDCHSSSNDL